MAILRAADIARYFLAKQDPASAGEPITNLKLQKLCYYAQGITLAKLRRPLFFEDIEHWQQGPVVPALWREYKQFGERPIPSPELPKDFKVFDSETRSVLDFVIKTYGRLFAWELRNMTHTEPPWQGTPDRASITHQKMRTYFETPAETMPTWDQHEIGDAESPSLALQMANDTEFIAITERGLADLAAGRYSSLEDVRKSLGSV